MSKSFYFAKKIQVLDDKINSCMSDIASLFNGIENLNKHYTVMNMDEVFTEELYEMLQKLDTILSQTPAVAEFILPHLEELRKQNTISLIEDLLLDFNNTNFPMENLADKITLLWKKNCYHLEKYSSVLLQENYMPLQSAYSNFNLYLLKNFVHRLQHMYVPDLVWQKYRNFRHLYFENYSCPCSVAGSCLNCCLKLTIQCIYEDELLAFIGCFHPYTVTQSKVFETYFDVIDKKFYEVLKVLEDCFTLRRNLPEDIISVLRSFNSAHIETCFSCFMQSQISLEVDSAVYCIQNNYGIESVWNTVLTSCIVRIIEVILLFEDKINTLFHREKPTYHNHDDELLTLIEGSKLVLATESPEESPIYKPLYPSSSKKQLCLMENEKIFLIWSWRLAMVENRSLIRLQRSLQNDIESILRTFIELEKKKLKSGHWKDLLPSKQETFFSEYVQTNTLLQSVFNTVQNLEKYMPVLSTKCESFQSFKSSFLHTLETYVINLIRHLKEISECHNSNCVIYYKYIALNNAIFLKDRLQNYCDILKSSTCEVSENNILHSITHLTNDLLESVYLLQFRYISCGMLFDADCNKFDDQKPFFEGERISYCIQMWNLHMKGLLTDLSYFLPQKVAKDLYVHILSSSLDHFLARYSHATPSEARTPQVLFDINALLLCTSELLWPACSSVCQFIGRKLEMEEETIASSINKIHSSCSFLLAVLVVLNAPVCELHKSFKDGFPQAQLSVRTKYETVAPWLPWIRRELFSEFCQRQIISNVSVWLAVRVCTSWCLPNPITVVKAFTEHNCTLSILLMMQAASSSSIKNRNQSSSLENYKIKLAHSLFELLICFGNHSHLQDILLPVVEKTNGWQEFDAGAAIKPLSEHSWWYIGLVQALKSFYVSVFEEIIPVWFKVSKKRGDTAEIQAFNSLKSSFVNHIVCVCEKEPLNSCQDEFELSDEVIAYVCIKKVLESMQRNIASLSQTLKCFLMSLNFHITNYVPEIQSVCQSLPLQILLSSAIDFLRDTEFQNKISKDLQEMTVITATALETLLLKTDIYFINENYTRILKILLSSIHENFNDLKQYIEKHSEKMHTKEIRDETLEITVYKILQLFNGKDIILYLHRLLCENESWIQKSLGVPGMLSSDIVIDPLSPSPLLVNNSEIDDKGHREKDLPTYSNQKPSSQACMDPIHHERNQESFDSGCKPSVETEFPNFSPCDFQGVIGVLNLEVNEIISVPKFKFDPLKCFDELGESNFAQFVIDKPSFHWESILSHLPILGLTEVNFCTILSHRWDVRNEGPLTDEEQKCIDELRTVYKITD